jgi:hypothetical protein
MPLRTTAQRQLSTALQSCAGRDTLTIMRRLHLLVISSLALQPATISAQPAATVTVPTTQQVHGLNADEASALIANLSEAQSKLRAGELQSSFQQVWKIERAPTDNRLWQPFRLSYAPNGLGQPYWDIEVVLGFHGQLERVTMNYKPPAPF